MNELKKWRDSVTAEQEAYLNLKRDVEELKNWKSNQKKDAEERVRRWWTFGPNVVAALIGLVGIALTILINLIFAYFSLKKPVLRHLC